MTVKPNPIAQFTPPAREDDKTRRWYLVRVRDLLLSASIGVYDHEKKSPQRVRINVELKVLEGDGPIGDDISNVLSYEDIVNGIKTILANGHGSRGLCMLK